MEMIFVMMPPTFINANFFGLPSCLSFANGIVEMASSAMIAALSERYSGCSVIHKSVASGCCIAITTMLKNTVETIIEMLVVLKTDCLFSLVENLK